MWRLIRRSGTPRAASEAVLPPPFAGSAASRAPRPRGGEAAKRAFELLGEDESGGVDGNGARRVERGGDLFGRALSRERSPGLVIEELDEIVGCFSEAPTQEVGGAAGDVDTHAGIEQPEREAQHGIARREEAAVVLTHEKAGVDEFADESPRSASQPLVDFGECHLRGLIIGPARAKGLIDSEPFAHGRAFAARPRSDLIASSLRPRAWSSAIISSRSRCPGL